VAERTRGRATAGSAGSRTSLCSVDSGAAKKQHSLFCSLQHHTHAGCGKKVSPEIFLQFAEQLIGSSTRNFSDMFGQSSYAHRTAIVL